jgi:hypothetical protein
MARKKHKKKVHHRRRVGAFGGRLDIKSGLMMIAGAGLGVLGGRLLNATLAPTVGTATVPPTLLGFGEAAIGGFVAAKATHPFLKGAGAAIAGNGLVFALGTRGMALLPASIGYGPDPMHRPSRAMLQGYRDVPKIGFPKPGNIGAHRDRRRQATMYAGVYG